jgi:hypothetical protein
MGDIDELDDLIQGATPEEKLVNAKEIIQSLEKEAFKLRAELKRTEATVKKLQESVSLSSQNQNNTSSAFMLPSEFKKLWEVLVMENCLDLFTPFLDNPSEFAYLVQTLFKEILKYVETSINSKISTIIDLLGIKECNPDKLKKYLLKLFQDHYNTAFPLDCQVIGSLFKSSLPVHLQSKIKPLLSSSDFSVFVSTAHKLSVTMLLNDPVLNLKFPSSPEVLALSKPDDFYFIDGFPVGSPDGLLILPAVTRGTFPYAGTKPAVLVLEHGLGSLEPSVPDVKENPKLETHKSADPCLKHKAAIGRYADDQEPYPPLQRKQENTGRKECPLCRIKAPCAYCSKSTLLALAKRVSNSGFGVRQYSRIQSNSLITTPGKTNKGLATFLSRRLSEAGKRGEKNTQKNRQIDKEACKVM